MNRLGHTPFSAGIGTPNTSRRAEGRRGGCVAASSQAGSVYGQSVGVGLEWGSVILSPPSVLFFVDQHVILEVTSFFCAYCLCKKFLKAIEEHFSEYVL